MFSRYSRVLSRSTVMTIALAAFVIAALQVRTLWKVESGFPLSLIEAYSPLIFSVYGGLVALLISRKLPDRADTRVAALSIAFFALALSLVVVPSGSPSVTHRAAFSISLVYLPLFVRFTMLFPREISRSDLEALDSRNGDGSRAVGLRGMFRRAQSVALTHPSVLWWLGAFLVGLYYFHATFVAHPYYLNYSDVEAALAWVSLLTVLPLWFAFLALAASFLWTGYRLANTEERGKILWIVLSALFNAFLMGSYASLTYLVFVTDGEVLWRIQSAVAAAVFPLAEFAALTGFAVAILYHGAFDVRPVISRTTVYGTLVVLFVVTFAVIESVIEGVVEERLGLPESFGSAIAAAGVALALIPVHNRLRTIVDRILREGESGNAGEPHQV